MAVNPEIDMSLNETDWRHFDNLYAEKHVSISEEHEQKMRALLADVLRPKQIIRPMNSAPYLRDMQDRLDMIIEEIKRFAKESVLASIDTFIEVHRGIDLHPDDGDVETFRQQLANIPERCIGTVEEYYKGDSSPIPSKSLVSEWFDSLRKELRKYPTRFSPRLDAFLTHSARCKERGLPLNSPTQSVTNMVNVGRDINGPVQVDTVHSTQNVIESIGHNELSKENALEAGTKIAECLTAKDIWKGEWVYFKDIAEATGVEVWVVKECIDYAAMLAYLKIGSRLPDSVLLVRSWGGL